MQHKLIKLHLKILLASSYEDRIKGLLDHKKPITDEGLLIPQCNSVHMFFMRFPIDVVFLDHVNKVVKVTPHLKPWQLVPPVNGAYAALELPIETIRNYDICVGDTLIMCIKKLSHG